MAAYGQNEQHELPARADCSSQQIPDTDIAWFNAGKHPAQGIIANSSSTEQVIAGGASHTTSSLSKAGTSTGVAISVAQDDTGNAIQESYRRTKHALGASARHVVKARHPHKILKSLSRQLDFRMSFRPSGTDFLADSDSIPAHPTDLSSPIRPASGPRRS